jgi:hypothetical protein
MKKFFGKPPKPEKSESNKVSIEIEQERKNLEEIKERFKKLEEDYQTLKSEIEKINFIEEAKKFFEKFFRLSKNYSEIFNKFKSLQPEEKEKYKEKIKEIGSSLIGLIEKINIYIISYILTKNRKLIKLSFLNISYKEIYMPHLLHIIKEEIIENIVKKTLDDLFENDKNYLDFRDYIETFWWRSDLNTIRNYLLIGLLRKSSSKIEEEINEEEIGVGRSENWVDIETKLRNLDDLLNEIKKILERYENYLNRKLRYPIRTKIMIHRNIFGIWYRKSISPQLDFFEKELNLIRNYLWKYRFNNLNSEIERIQFLMDSLKI